ncbi:MAG: GNAT family N-acetyltransferase [Fimbriimonadaceae bacterium]|nr:GNAT family N-acetyltransferase [Fimbriimonadaceae bacterium]
MPIKPKIALVPMDVSHFDRFFEFESDKEAVWMAAFATVANDREEFMQMWRRRIENPGVTHLTVLVDGEVAGGILAYGEPGSRHIGYWIGREYWGQGVATAAVAGLLELMQERPVFATCAADNTGSRRVLERNGFRFTHMETHHAKARNAPVEEAFYRLDPS